MKAKPKHPRIPARTTAAVGRLMWAVKAVAEKAPESFYVFTTPPLPKRLLTPVLVIPCDKEGVEKLRRELETAFSEDWRNIAQYLASQALAAIGIPPHAATGRGKK